jgi:uncharacterized lipoprotein YajG
MSGYFLLPKVLTGNHSINNKNLNMKKFFFVLAIGAFAACNNSSSTEAKTDSAATHVDSSATHVDSSAAKVDSSAAKVDSAAKKVDSPKK